HQTEERRRGGRRHPLFHPELTDRLPPQCAGDPRTARERSLHTDHHRHAATRRRITPARRRDGRANPDRAARACCHRLGCRAPANARANASRLLRLAHGLSCQLADGHLYGLPDLCLRRLLSGILLLLSQAGLLRWVLPERFDRLRFRRRPLWRVLWRPLWW